jgi:DNA-binding sugar fermentation-stimulating protein
LGNLFRLIKDDYTGDYNIQARRLKGGSSYSIVDTNYADKVIAENLSQQEIEEFAKAKEIENQAKLSKLARMINPFQIRLN